MCEVFVNVAGTQMRTHATPSDLERLAVGDGVETPFGVKNVWPVPADSDMEIETDEVGAGPTEKFPLAITDATG